MHDERRSSPEPDDARAILADFLEREGTALLRRIASSGVRPRASADVEDVVQEATTSALQACPRLDSLEDARLRPWLVCIARNQVRSALRRRAFEADWSSEGEVDETPAPARGTALAGEWLGIVWRLPAPERATVLLRQCLHFSWETIALVTDKPSAQAARQQYLRDLRRLRRSGTVREERRR